MYQIILKILFVTTILFVIQVEPSLATTDRTNCIKLRCTYRLINPHVFSAEELILAVTQSVTGQQFQPLDRSKMWIGTSLGTVETVEVVYSAPTPAQVKTMTETVIAIDNHYNTIGLTPVRITAQIYAIDEDKLTDIGIGVDGFSGGNHFTGETGGGVYSPMPGNLLAFAGGAKSLLRIRLRAAVENGEALRIEDRSQVTYHGARFDFSDTQDYHRDTNISTVTGSLGFRLGGNVFVNQSDSSVTIDNLSLYLGFAPESETPEVIDQAIGIVSHRSPLGVRKIENNDQLSELKDGVPKVIYENIVYTNFDRGSFGLFTGINKGGSASRLLIILTAEVNPEERTPPKDVVNLSKKVRNAADHKKEKSKKTPDQDDDYSSEYSWYLQ